VSRSTLVNLRHGVHEGLLPTHRLSNCGAVAAPCRGREPPVVNGPNSSAAERRQQADATDLLPPLRGFGDRLKLAPRARAPGKVLSPLCG
jgi:hypothetical protein